MKRAVSGRSCKCQTGENVGVNRSPVGGPRHLTVDLHDSLDQPWYIAYLPRYPSRLAYLEVRQLQTSISHAIIHLQEHPVRFSPLVCQCGIRGCRVTPATRRKPIAILVTGIARGDRRYFALLSGGESNRDEALGGLLTDELPAPRRLELPLRKRAEARRAFFSIKGGKHASFNRSVPFIQFRPCDTNRLAAKSPAYARTRPSSFFRPASKLAARGGTRTPKSENCAQFCTKMHNHRR